MSATLGPISQSENFFRGLCWELNFFPRKNWFPRRNHFFSFSKFPWCLFLQVFAVWWLPSTCTVDTCRPTCTWTSTSFNYALYCACACTVHCTWFVSTQIGAHDSGPIVSRLAVLIAKRALRANQRKFGFRVKQRVWPIVPEIDRFELNSACLNARGSLWNVYLPLWPQKIDLFRSP